MAEVMTGAWTAYSTEISAEQKALLAKAVGIGINYNPFAVATQVVSGVNYRFLCNAEVAIPNAPIECKLVQFYVSAGSQDPTQLAIQNVPC